MGHKQNGINITSSWPDLATATSLTTKVPLKAGSGKISVATPTGTGMSSADFYIPPLPFVPADVGVTDRMPLGDTRTFSLMPPTSRVALIVFDGTAGQQIRLTFSSVTAPVMHVSIYNPDGTILVPKGTVSSGSIIGPTTLPLAGTFTIVVSLLDTITTVAGNGGTGGSGDGGPAINAEINGPSGVAVDSAGNLFIASGECRIRKVDLAGIITTVAGSGMCGYNGDNIPATSASLGQPYGVAVDSAGNLFIADTFNHRIRKVGTDGIITTVAGDGNFGFGGTGDGGLATSARLNGPKGVLVDSQGSLFIVSTDEHRIRKVNSAGIITTVAGSSQGYNGDGFSATLARLQRPQAVAQDAQGNLFIADMSNFRVRKVDTSGIITTVAGNGSFGHSGDGGLATQAAISRPTGVAVDGQGNLLISAQDDHRIRKVTTVDGTITTIVGSGTGGFSGDNGPAIDATVFGPLHLAVQGAANLFIADQVNNRIRKTQPASPGGATMTLTSP